MLVAILNFLSLVLEKYFGGMMTTKASADAMAKAFYEEQNKEIISQMGKAYEKPSTYYDGNPNDLLEWVRKRELDSTAAN
jgi:hypothetical protein